MVVYVENVLFENLIIDSLILFLVAKTLKEKTNWWGIVISSLFGAVFALFSVKIDVNGFFAILIKLFVCMCMAYLLDFSYKKLFLKSGLLFLYTFLFGGMVTAIFGFLGISAKNGLAITYLSDIPIVGITVLCLVLCLWLLYYLRKLYKHKKISAFLYDISLSINKKNAVLSGFLDTGNTITSKTGRPVVMIAQKELKRFFNDRELLFFALKEYEKLPIKKPQIISVASISGKTEVLVFEAEECIIDKNNVDICIGVCDNKMFKNKGFDAILSPKMLEGKNV